MNNELAWKLNVIALQDQRLSSEQVSGALALVNDPGWRAALTILTSDFFENDARVWRHVDLRERSIYFRDMLGVGTFSSGELTLLKIAASLFNEEVSVNLHTAFDRSANEVQLSRSMRSQLSQLSGTHQMVRSQ